MGSRVEEKDLSKVPTVEPQEALVTLGADRHVALDPGAVLGIGQQLAGLGSSPDRLTTQRRSNQRDDVCLWHAEREAPEQLRAKPLRLLWGDAVARCKRDDASCASECCRYAPLHARSRPANTGCPQSIDATVRLNTSDGFIQPSVCLGRLFSSLATAFR